MKKITENNYKEIINKSEISDVHFYGIDFSGQDLSFINICDTHFEKCNLSNVLIKETTLNNVEFKNSKIMGLKFVDISQFLSNFNFSDCKISLSSFYGLTLKNISFAYCEVKETDFASSDLEGAEFMYCDLEKSIFNDTNLKNASFNGSYNFIIDPTKNNLQKTKFTRENALGLLSEFDIIIE